jgi:hypothetical protein
MCDVSSGRPIRCHGSDNILGNQAHHRKENKMNLMVKDLIGAVVLVATGLGLFAACLAVGLFVGFHKGEHGSK